MNKTLKTKIINEVNRVASKKAAKTILNTVDKDLILPLLSLDGRTKIEAKADDSYIYLYIGRRDFQFYVGSGRFMGCGTYLG
jgi:hypothetical protein